MIKFSYELKHTCLSEKKLKKCENFQKSDRRFELIIALQKLGWKNNNTKQKQNKKTNNINNKTYRFNGSNMTFNCN